MSTEREQEIINNPNLGYFEKLQLLAEMREQESRQQQTAPGRFQTLLHSIVGAALGSGVAKGVSALLPVSSNFADKLQTIGMGVGALMNSGIIKRSKEILDTITGERKDAFRLGFMKAAVSRGLFKQAMLMPMLSIDPAGLFAIPRGIAQATTTAGEYAGGALGAAGNPTESDKDVLQMEAEKEVLKQTLKRLKAARNNRILKQVLAKNR